MDGAEILPMKNGNIVRFVFVSIRYLLNLDGSALTTKNNKIYNIKIYYSLYNVSIMFFNFFCLG